MQHISMKSIYNDNIIIKTTILLDTSLKIKLTHFYTL